MKWSAEAVGGDPDPCPDSVNLRSSSQALYAAMPPLTPNDLGSTVSPSPRLGCRVRPQHTTGPTVGLPGLWKSQREAENNTAGVTAPDPRWPRRSAAPR